MNKNITPTTGTAAASVWFAEYLQNKLGGLKCGPHKANERTLELCQAVGIDRKTIYAYARLERSPKLEVVAKILEYYGEKDIKIPLTLK